MSGFERLTASSATDDALDALYARLEAAELAVAASLCGDSAPSSGFSGPVGAVGGECGARDAATAPDGSDARLAVPVDTLRLLVRVAAHVSLGRSAAFIAPYPDATARYALGELDDAGLLDQLSETPNPEGP